MSEATNDVYEKNTVSLSKEEAEQWLGYIQAIDRLKENPDFRMLFDVYTRSEVLRNSYLLTDMAVTMSTSKKQLEENVIDAIKAAAYFRNYIMVDLEKQRNLIEKALQDYREEASR